MSPEASAGAPAVDWEAMEAIPADPTDTGDHADTLIPGSRSECPDCHKTLNVTAQGKLRSHTCVNDVPKKRGTRTRGSKNAPSKEVRAKCVMVLAGAIESGAEFAVSRYVPCPMDAVPADIDSPEDMVGPLVDLIWPTLPKGAQKAISLIADESDLIVMAIAWWEWGRALQQWSVQQRARTLAEAREEKARLQVVPVPGMAPVPVATDGGDFSGLEVPTLITE